MRERAGAGPRATIALTGADGMLGRELRSEAAARDLDLLPWDLEDFDLTDRDAVLRAVGAARPRAVIHAGAWTDVDGCESDPERAFLVNGRATAHVVDACREAGARLVMVSTDYVFSGTADRPYLETDAPGPRGAYGWSKLVGEECVRGLGPDGVIVRTAWLYADHGRNFLRTMLRLGRERTEIAVVDDQVGSPTFAADLAVALLDLEASGTGGIFHVTNGGRVSWYGFARKIFELAGIHVDVRPVTTEEFPRPTERPRNSVLADTRLEAAGLRPLAHWEDALGRCLARMELDPTREARRAG